MNKTLNIQIVSSWADVTIAMYDRLISIDTTQSESEQLIDTMCVLSTLTRADAERMPYTDFIALASRLSFLSNVPTWDKQQPSPSLTIQGKEYHVPTSVREIVAAQFIDYQTLSSRMELSAGHKMSRLLSCFVTPMGKEYGEGYDIDALEADIYNAMSVEEAHTLLGFFTELWRVYTLNTLQSLRCETEKMQMTAEQRKQWETIQPLLTETEAQLSLAGGGLS